MSDPVRDNIIFYTAYIGGILCGLLISWVWCKYRKLTQGNDLELKDLGASKDIANPQSQALKEDK